MSDRPTIGAYLRSARRRRRISIERAAEGTKIRSDFLMRMESDEFDFLAPAYVRGFLRSYARYLRVDPDPLVKELDRRLGTRIDTAEIIAERRRKAGRSLREPRRPRGWALAAILAGLVLVLLAVIGLAQPDTTTPPRNPDLAAKPTTVESPTPQPSATPTPHHTKKRGPRDGALAFDNGIEVEVRSTTARCWVDFTADGNHLTPGGITLEVGQATSVFRADRKMEIVLGAPWGVELIVNGHNIGSPGGSGATTITIPDDISSF